MPRRGALRSRVGTFDGVHVGHRDVIARRRHRVTFEPHPVIGGRARTHAAAAHTAPGQGRPDRLAGRRGADRRSDSTRRSRRSAPRVRRRGAGRPRSAHAKSRSARTSASARRAQGDAAMLAADGRFATRVVPLREVDGEIVSSSRIRSLIAAGEVGRAGALLGDPFELRGDGGQRRPPRAHARLPDRQPRSAAGRSSIPGHGVYACLANGAPGGRQHRRAPDVRLRPRAS